MIEKKPDYFKNGRKSYEEFLSLEGNFFTVKKALSTPNILELQNFLEKEKRSFIRSQIEYFLNEWLGHVSRHSGRVRALLFKKEQMKELFKRMNTIEAGKAYNLYMAETLRKKGEDEDDQSFEDKKNKELSKIVERHARSSKKKFEKARQDLISMYTFIHELENSVQTENVIKKASEENEYKAKLLLEDLTE